MQLVDNLNKISIGKIHGAKKDITIGDYAKLKQSNFITSFFLKIQLGLEGKGWWVKEKEIHALVKDMNWDKVHNISVWAEIFLSHPEVDKNEIQAVHTLFSNEKTTRRKPLEAKFIPLENSTLSDVYKFDKISEKLVDDYINFFLLENENNITITSSMQVAKKYLVSEMVIKNNQKDYRSSHDSYVPQLKINGFIDYLVQKQLNDKLSAEEQKKINAILKCAEKGPKYFFILNRSLTQISEVEFHEDFKQFLNKKDLPKEMVLKEEEVLKEDEGTLKKLNFHAIQNVEGREEEIKVLFLKYLNHNKL